MSKIKMCDRCKNKMDYGFKIKISSKYINIRDINYHLCDDCFDDYYASIKQFLGGDNNAK